MNAKDCIKERRSIRKFKADPVDHALLSEIVETASYAPSWKHTQIARYIAVEGDLKNKIAAQCTDAYPRNGEIIAQAPMLIAVTFLTLDTTMRESSLFFNKIEEIFSSIFCGRSILL